jgi:hypothetical protein
MKHLPLILIILLVSTNFTHSKPRKNFQASLSVVSLINNKIYGRVQYSLDSTSRNIIQLSGAFQQHGMILKNNLIDKRIYYSNRLFSLIYKRKINTKLIDYVGIGFAINSNIQKVFNRPLIKQVVNAPLKYYYNYDISYKSNFIELFLEKEIYKYKNISLSISNSFYLGKSDILEKNIYSLRDNISLENRKNRETLMTDFLCIFLNYNF